jgi:hypothetical protein
MTRITCLCEALRPAWEALERYGLPISKLNRVQDNAEHELMFGLWEPFLTMTGHAREERPQ